MNTSNTPAFIHKEQYGKKSKKIKKKLATVKLKRTKMRRK